MLSVDQRDGLMRANKPWGPDPKIGLVPTFRLRKYRHSITRSH
jgi:hypothetical protein